MKANDDRDLDATVMALIITGTTITSDHSPHTARQAPGRQFGWEVSWLPGKVLDRDTATTAMILADIAAKGDLHHGHRLWPVVERWAADLGLTGSDAITQASRSPRDLDRNQDHGTRQIDLEGAE
jgi:hypothetical protein